MPAVHAKLLVSCPLTRWKLSASEESIPLTPKLATRSRRGRVWFLAEDDVDLALLQFQKRLSVVGSHLESQGEILFLVGSRIGKIGQGFDLDLRLKDAEDLVGHELLEEVLVVQHRALGNDHPLVAGGKIRAGLHDIERRHDPDFRALEVV